MTVYLWKSFPVVRGFPSKKSRRSNQDYFSPILKSDLHMEVAFALINLGSFSMRNLRHQFGQLRTGRLFLRGGVDYSACGPRIILDGGSLRLRSGQALPAMTLALALRGVRGGAPRRGGSVRLKEIPDQVGDDMRLERGGRLPPYAPSTYNFFISSEMAMGRPRFRSTSTHWVSDSKITLPSDTRSNLHFRMVATLP